MIDENGSTLALKIVELYEEREALKSRIYSYSENLAKVSELSRKRDGLAVRSMQGIDEEYEKILDEAGIKRLSK